MQVKVKNSNVFEPFTLEITIENEAEANILWHRLNMSFDEVKSTADESYEFIDNEEDLTYELFKALDDLYRPKHEGLNDENSI
jgi:hypothetical protein